MKSGNVSRWAGVAGGVLLMTFWGTLASAEMGGQVFYRFGSAALSEDRGGEVFTDTLNVTGAGENNDKGKYAIGAGLDIPLAPLFGNTLLGEVMEGEVRPVWVGAVHDRRFEIPGMTLV